MPTVSPAPREHPSTQPPKPARYLRTEKISHGVATAMTVNLKAVKLTVICAHCAVLWQVIALSNTVCNFHQDICPDWCLWFHVFYTVKWLKSFMRLPRHGVAALAFWMDYVGWSVPSGHYRAILKACQVHIASPPEDVTSFSAACQWLKHGKRDLPLQIGGQVTTT